MPDDRYDFCKIFVGRTDDTSVMELLAVLLSGQFHRRSMELDDAVIGVRVNPDADSVAAASDDFVRWPVLVEVERGDSAEGSAMVDTVGRILTALWHADRPAVAACDFEDELPWGGGIQRLRGST